MNSITLRWSLAVEGRTLTYALRRVRGLQSQTQVDIFVALPILKNAFAGIIDSSLYGPTFTTLLFQIISVGFVFSSQISAARKNRKFTLFFSPLDIVYLSYMTECGNVG